MIQVKKGNIGLSIWRKSLAGQLSELFFRSLDIPRISEDDSRRMLLISSGILERELLKAIDSWNNKFPIPIEIFDVNNLAELLQTNGYDIRKLENELLREAIGIIE